MTSARRAPAFARASTPLATGLLAMGMATGAAAQVVLDPGFSSDTVGPGDYAPGQSTDYLIREAYGRRAGSNLFHRFSRFDVPSGQSATFVEDAPGSGIRRIVSHVGGTGASRIDGVLRSTIPDADLYLYNARGVVFGPEARLDLQGAFHASSAEQIRFDDDVVFGESASGPEITLTAADPAAWGFLRQAPAALALEGAALAVPERTALSLTGGPLRIEGSGAPAPSPSLAAPSGALRLVAVGSPGEVAIDPRSDGGVSAFETLAPVEIAGGALVDASGDLDQILLVRADALLVDGAAILAHHTGAADHPGRAIDIAVRDALRLGDPAAGTTGRLESLALREDAPGGGPGPDVGDGGDVLLAADRLTVEGAGSSVIVGTACSAGFACDADRQPGGAGGALQIDVDTLAIRNLGFVAVLGAGSGRGSAATIRARAVEVANDPGSPRGPDPGTFLGTFAFGGFAPGPTPPPPEGDAGAGAIRIEASESVRVENGAEIRSITFQNGAGGDLGIETGRFEASDTAVTARAGIRTATEIDAAGSPFGQAGRGEAGDLTIEARETIRFENAFASSRARSGASGATGAITLRAPDGSISLVGRSEVDVQSVDGGGAPIELEARRIELRDGGLVQSTVVGDGAAGDIGIRADSVLLRGRDVFGARSGLFSKPLSPNAPGAGAGGTIRVDGRRLRIDEGATIELSSLQNGPAGDLVVGGDAPLDAVVLDGGSITSETSDLAAGGGSIAIDARRIVLRHGSRLSTANLASGDAGTIELRGGQLRVRDGSVISTESGRFGPGAGGDVTIAMRGTTLVESSRIAPDARSASPTNQGGNIDVRSEVLVLSRSALGASAPAGSGGNIEIVAGRFVQTPASTLDATGASPERDGLVRILSAETNILGAIPRLPVVYEDPANRLATGCEERTEARGSLYVLPPAIEAPPGTDLDAPETDVDPGAADRCGRAS